MMEKEYNNNSLPNNFQKININEVNHNDYNDYINELMNKQNMLERENNNLRIAIIFLFHHFKIILKFLDNFFFAFCY